MPMDRQQQDVSDSAFHGESGGNLSSLPRSGREDAEAAGGGSSSSSAAPPASTVTSTGANQPTMGRGPPAVVPAIHHIEGAEASGGGPPQGAAFPARPGEEAAGGGPTPRSALQVRSAARWEGPAQTADAEAGGGGPPHGASLPANAGEEVRSAGRWEGHAQTSDAEAGGGTPAHSSAVARPQLEMPNWQGARSHGGGGGPETSAGMPRRGDPEDGGGPAPRSLRGGGGGAVSLHEGDGAAGGGEGEEAGGGLVAVRTSTVGGGSEAEWPITSAATSGNHSGPSAGDGAAGDGAAGGEAAAAFAALASYEGDGAAGGGDSEEAPGGFASGGWPEVEVTSQQAANLHESDGAAGSREGDGAAGSREGGGVAGREQDEGRTWASYSSIRGGDGEAGGGPGLHDMSMAWPLKLTIVSARGLRDADWVPGAGKSDPYCVCEIAGKPREAKVQTKVINDTLDPVWEHQAELPGFRQGDTLVFKVWDKDLGKSDFLGELHLESAQFCPHGFDGELLLANAGRGIKAYLKLKIQPATARPVAAARVRQLNEAAEVAGGGSATGWGSSSGSSHRDYDGERMESSPKSAASASGSDAVPVASGTPANKEQGIADSNHTTGTSGRSDLTLTEAVLDVPCVAISQPLSDVGSDDEGLASTSGSRRRSMAEASRGDLWDAFAHRSLTAVRSHATDGSEARRDSAGRGSDDATLTSSQERQNSSVAIRDMFLGKDTDCEGDAEAESRASEDSIEEQQREEDRLRSTEVVNAGLDFHRGNTTRSWDDCAAIQRSSPGLQGSLNGRGIATERPLNQGATLEVVHHSSSDEDESEDDETSDDGSS